MEVTAFNELRVNREVCDGEIRTSDGGKFPIHRVILSAFSPYFRAYFTNTLHNSETTEYSSMVISDVPAFIVGMIIEFAYTKKCAVTVDNVHALMIAADQLSCDTLVSFCSDFLTNNLTPENCISTFKFAKQYFCRNLQINAWQYLINNIERAMFCSDFKTLTAEELQELLKADELNVRREETVFDALSLWVLEDPETRRKDFSELIHCVRFGLLSQEYYVNVIKCFQYNTEESLALIRTIDHLYETNEDGYYFRYCYFRPRIPNEVVFTFGGWSEGTPTDIIETYDKRSDSWYLANFTDLRVRAYHGVMALGNLIYVIGGFDGKEYFSTMHCFNPIENKWTEKACMHDVRCYVSICTLGGDIYAIGGYNGRVRLNTAEKYNPVQNQWTVIASMNRLRSDGSAATFNNKIFVAGGFNGEEVMRSVEMYCPVLNRWDFVDCMRSPRSGVSLITHGLYIYALGGFDGVSRLCSGERYSPQYNQWDAIADMLCPRSNLSSVIVDSHIFVIGGFNGSTTIPYTEFYDEENNMWCEAACMNVNRSALSACVCSGLPNIKKFTFLGTAVDHTGGGEWTKITL